MFDIGDTVYLGQRRGKVTGYVWPGPEPIDGVVTLPTDWVERTKHEAIAYFVTFAGRRGPVRVGLGEVSRVMAMPFRVTTKAG